MALASSSAAAESATDGLPDSARSFIDGNLHFIAYHELGHALVSEFAIPVLGREEDAVDRLAIWMMTPETDEEDPEYLTVAMEGWFASAASRSLDDIAWWGEHGTDEQRGYQIACLLYGWDPEAHAAIAEAAELPEDRRQTCEGEAQSNDIAWRTVLEPHFRPDGEPRAEGSVEISYAPTERFQAELDYLKELGLLEHLAELIETDYAFEPGITVAAETCDEPNAFWNADDRKITICYELVEDFRRMAAEME